MEVRDKKDRETNNKPFTQSVSYYLSFCLYFFQIFLSFLIISVVCAVPGDNEDVQELVRYYHNLLYTSKEICGFLLLVHNIMMSLSTFKRLRRRLNLVRRRTPVRAVINEIMELRSQGLVNLGYRAMWRVLNISRNINVSQETVRICLKKLTDMEWLSELVTGS